jgi:hypothetical protein
MIINCEVCKKEFYIRPGDFKLKKYSCCSRECSFKNPKRKFTIGEISGNWKGENAGYTAIHHWVRKRKNNLNICEKCGKKTDFLDLANISQKYSRDLSDWEYLCRRCHMEKDGRLYKLANNPNARIKRGLMVNCELCNKKVYKMRNMKGP